MLNSLRRMVFVAATLLFLPIVVAHAVEIKWEVGNRFRTFDFYSNDSESAARMFESFAPRVDEATSQQWLARLVREGGSPYSAERGGPWREDPGGANAEYDRKLVDPPDMVLVRAQLAESERGTAELSGFSGKTCTWRVGTEPATLQPCEQPFIVSMPFSGAVISVEGAGGAVRTAVQVNPKFRIILGLGDSYGAGEGSPDVPTQWDPSVTMSTWILGKRTDVDGAVQKSASWWSTRCNRSFYSFQNMVALRMAGDDTHAVVSFVHLACAGAEVVDGLLAPQRMAPGRHRGCTTPSRRSDPNSVDNECDVPQSQMRAAVSILCRHQTEALVPSRKATIISAIGKLRQAPEQTVWINELVECPVGKMRPVDTLLLSIGGNDMGFAGVILWALAPAQPSQIFGWKQIMGPLINYGRKESGAVCPTAGALGLPCTGLPADVRIKDIPSRLAGLDVALRTLLVVDSKRIIHTQYPNPLFDAKGSLCANLAGSYKNNDWYATRLMLPASYRWQINIVPAEGGSINKHVVLALNDTIANAARRAGWRSPSVSDAMKGAGWCMGPNRVLLGPDKVSTWRANEDHVRFIRTANDSLLSQWSAYAENRNDGYSGTFHPNPQGYAAIADAVIPLSRAIDAVKVAAPGTQ